jgi:hypothetical protein
MGAAEKPNARGQRPGKSQKPKIRFQSAREDANARLGFFEPLAFVLYLGSGSLAFGVS